MRADAAELDPHEAMQFRHVRLALVATGLPRGDLGLGSLVGFRHTDVDEVAVAHQSAHTSGRCQLWQEIALQRADRETRLRLKWRRL